MKHLLIAIMALLCIVTSCTSKAQNNESTTDTNNMKKSIVIYFSRSGNNYVSGDIVNLKVGNTKVIAQKIVKATGCDEFEIIPEKPYAEDYTRCTEEAQAELNANARPAYKGDIDLSEYDTIYLGYPIWWGTFPMPVFTFIEAHDGFAGKTVLPYSTHEGSGLGQSISDLRKLCPKATVKSGVAIKGSTVQLATVDKIINQ